MIFHTGGIPEYYNKGRCKMKINIAKNGKVQLQWHNIAFVLKKEKDIIRKGRKHGRIKSLKIRINGEIYLLTNSVTHRIYHWYSIDVPKQQEDGISRIVSEYIL